MTIAELRALLAKGRSGMGVLDDAFDALPALLDAAEALERSYYWAQQERVAIDRIDEYEADMAKARAALAKLDE